MIADRLYALRIEKGLTQQKVADGIGLDRVTYTRYENGTRSPIAENIVKLADFYEVSTDYLLGRTDIPNIYIHTLEWANGKEKTILSYNKDIPSPEEREDIEKRIKDIVADPEKNGVIKGSSIMTPEEIALLVQKLVPGLVDQRINQRLEKSDVLGSEPDVQ